MDVTIDVGSLAVTDVLIISIFGGNSAKFNAEIKDISFYK